jgi:hypothetical protein
MPGVGTAKLELSFLQIMKILRRITFFFHRPPAAMCVLCDAADAAPHVASHERGGAVGENLL